MFCAGAPSLSTASSGHKTTQRILVVDDTESNCNVMRLLLEHIGFKFLDFAHNGLQAIEMVQRSDAEKNPYRLVFMDLHMPVMDGLTAFKNMKKVLSVTSSPTERDICVTSSPAESDICVTSSPAESDICVTSSPAESDNCVTSSPAESDICVTSSPAESDMCNISTC
jgi:CheY-like chemotaxis protein